MKRNFTFRTAGLCVLAGGLLMSAAAVAAPSRVSAEDPVDFTGWITNPSFESGFSGWNQKEMQAQTNNTFPLKEGNTYVEKWVPATSGAGSCSVAQEVKYLLPGTYRLRAAAQNHLEGNGESQTGVWIFGNDSRTDVSVIDDYAVDFTVGESGVASIGYMAEDATGNYLAVDNFRLEYIKVDNAAVDAFVQNALDGAAAYSSRIIGASEREALDSAIATLSGLKGQVAGKVEETVSALSALREAMEAAEVSAALYEKLSAALDDAKTSFEEIKGQPGTEEIEKKIKEAEKMLEDRTATAEEIESMAGVLENLVLAYKVSVSTGVPPTVTTHPYVARGATFVLGRMTVEGVADKDILEKGFCAATHPGAVFTDNRSTKTHTNNGTIYHVPGLHPSTVYYVRAYAITKDYAIGYGDEVKVITIPKGHITYSYRSNGAADDVNTRIVNAVESAIDCWENSTSITGLNLTVQYNSGVNTADCSYGGQIRVGPRENYQATGTLLHEMNHGVGVGQLAIWFGPDSPFRETGSSGLWLGRRATEIVRFLENDPEAMLHGDKTHMWPYGINGAHEDTGKEILYLGNGLVTQAVGEDALPPVAGRIHSPAWSFENRDDVKYYIKVENMTHNPINSFIVEKDANKVDWSVMTSDEAHADDSAAWYVDFDPVTCYYSFRNARTGNYLVWASESRDVVTSASPEEGHDLFHLTNSVAPFEMGTYKDYTYWITAGEKVSSPYSLAYGTRSGLYMAAFNLSDKNGSQRWHILDDEALAAYDEAAAGVGGIEADDAWQLLPGDVYDISGRLVRRNAADLDGIAPGIYIVSGRKILVR